MAYGKPILDRRAFIYAVAGFVTSPAVTLGANRATVYDFSAGIIPSGFAFERGGSAYLTRPDGSLEMFAADIPRFETTGNTTALLLEGAAHNLFGADQSFRRWQIRGQLTTSQSAQSGPSNEAAMRIIASGSPPGELVAYFDTPSGDWIGTASLYARAENPDEPSVISVMVRDRGTYSAQRFSKELVGRWSRLSSTHTWYANDKSVKEFVVSVTPNSLAGARAAIWSAQYEQGLRASSPIPAAEQAGRKADRLWLLAKDFSTTSGSIRLKSPNAFFRNCILIESESGEFALGINMSGQLTARVGNIRLVSDADIAGDSEIELAWDRFGVALASGTNGTSATRAHSNQGTVAFDLGSRIRILAGADDRLPANTHLQSVEIGTQHTGMVASPSIVPPSYKISFRDDFDDQDLTRINESATYLGKSPAWRSRYRHDRLTIINKEKQVYMDAAFTGTAASSLGVQPFRIQDGVLSIRANAADPIRVSPFIGGAKYTSGCITSELTHVQTYGYFEIRCRCPLGRGFWPAFWLLTSANHAPLEIDPLEASGSRRFSFHQGSVGGNQSSSPNRWIDGIVDTTAHFNTFGVEWTREWLIFSVNGRETFRQVNFVHENMYVLANLAVGSSDRNWIPDPDETTMFPATFDIDYIRCWQRI